jgi:LPXTG-motif cell wall-anchored protein
MKKLMLVSAAAAAALLSLGAAPAAAGSKDDKVVVCHVPPGNPNNAHNIVISVNALPAHLAHGDTEGPCTYPPRSQALLAPGTVAPGASFQATFVDCALGETVNFVLNGTTTPTACNGSAGQSRLPTVAGLPSAAVTLVAPTAPGDYTIVATGATSGTTASATITVLGATPSATPSGGLPQTGSDSGRTVQIGAGLIAVGAGLSAVAIRRRRAHA